ncbi:aspartyl aminopeptidase [Populus alba x Populus x berolinensis]|uniref:Aspartyl aminopeptidase n=1 Tax=Populus alba x Populus x berolinensis TaxID=444605 RepID=A0AAD6M2H1_9ROSI|nr:aspartyl aminopeptidase [Populus alba x Populus x berolinensis]
MWTFNPRSYRKPIPKLLYGMQPAIHRTFPSKEKFGSFHGIYNLEILRHLASQLLQIERVEDSWKRYGSSTILQFQLCFDSTSPYHNHTHRHTHSAQHSALSTNIKKKQSEMQKMQENSVASELINFLNASPTAFHAVEEAKRRLRNAGYEQVSERQDWDLEAGKRYFFTRNHSTIVAFAIGNKFEAGNGFYIVGAHTDSPCLKLKPVSKVTKGGYLKVGVQTYGSGLWHTWFDRDLTVAGRVIVKEEKDGSVSYSHRLVRIEEPILRVPTIAIHLDSNVNSDGFKVNTETQLLPVLATSIKTELNKAVAESGPVKSEEIQVDGKKSDIGMINSKHHSLVLEMIANQIGCKVDDICDFELQVCDTQPSVIAGAAKEFIFSGRLDNLCSSFCSLKALIDATSTESDLKDESGVRMVALFDHEEVGSNSAQGARSPVMLDALSRITSSFDSDSKLLPKAIQRSYLVSSDMAHALHPNYMDKHEDNHQPKLHGGLVIKHNANQRYATNAVTSFLFREIATKHNLPTQDFVVRNDMTCGSTIGPILASGVGIRTVDVGAPQLSMHSIREMCAVDDVKHSYEHFKAFFQEFSDLDAKITVDM